MQAEHSEAIGPEKAPGAQGTQTEPSAAEKEPARHWTQPPVETSRNIPATHAETDPALPLCSDAMSAGNAEGCTYSTLRLRKALSK